MFELLMNATDLPSFYSIHFAFLIGISMNLIWGWIVEDSFITTLSNSTKSSIYELPVYHSNLHFYPSNDIVNWLTRFIRRKQCPNDDGEDHISSFVYNH
jgi:uncharacterized membrane protein